MNENETHDLEGNLDLLMPILKKRKEKEKSQVKSLIFYLMKLEREEQTKPKTSRRNKIIETREKNQSNKK